METANVDIRKLQILSDRINQTLEALNQVRLSVHGLQHTAGVGTNVPGTYPNIFGYGPNVGIGNIPMPVSPYGVGLSHTGMVSDPRLLDPRLDPRFIDPRFMMGNLPIGGLSHTTLDPRTDPFLMSRVYQTFPFVSSVFPPVW